ncbi:unnamed protein product, partial [Mesorhabditis spiculigera]
MTAAHCLTMAKRRSLPMAVGYRGVELYRVTGHITSTSYNPQSHWYRIAKEDWAFLLLEEAFGKKFTGEIPELWMDGFETEKCFLMGYGTTEDPAYQPFPPIQKMAAIMEQRNDANYSTIVIERTENEAAACQGDSGSPILCIINGTFKAVGLMIGGTKRSTGTGNACPHILRNAYVPFRALLNLTDAMNPTTMALQRTGWLSQVIEEQNKHRLPIQ